MQRRGLDDAAHMRECRHVLAPGTPEPPAVDHGVLHKQQMQFVRQLRLHFQLYIWVLPGVRRGVVRAQQLLASSAWMAGGGWHVGQMCMDMCNDTYGK